VEIDNAALLPLFDAYLENPISIAFLIVAGFVGICSLLKYSAFPLKAILEVLVTLLNEFKDPKTTIQKLNALVVLGIFVLLLIDATSASVSEALAGQGERAISDSASTYILLFSLLFSLWFSPRVILDSEKEQNLLKKIDENLDQD